QFAAGDWLFSAWVRSASLREFGFPTLAYLSSATKTRGQSFCSAHISAAFRVISAGSKSVVYAQLFGSRFRSKSRKKAARSGSASTLGAQDESTEKQDLAHRLLPTPFSSPS